MGTPVPPCPPFCDERGWRVGTVLECIADWIHYESQFDENPKLKEARNMLMAAAVRLREPDKQE